MRLLDGTPQRDAHGKAFVRFAVDARWNDDTTWQRDEILGCVYADTKRVFVKFDDAYVPSRTLLGHDGDPRTDVCRPAAG